jgi:cellulose synthase/poly-beta-1,6-N-acetylglucosamine synthase-like glycosyltransferase
MVFTENRVSTTTGLDKWWTGGFYRKFGFKSLFQNLKRKFHIEIFLKSLERRGMIVEMLQAASMLLHQRLHMLILFFISFTLVPAVAIKVKSRNYKVFDGKVKPVTVVVPVHTEDYKIFERSMKSIHAENPDQIIVSIDSNDQKLIHIAKKYGAEILKHRTRVGKRKALAMAWEKAKNDIIVQVDSDIFLQKGCLSELSKPFDDSSTVGVAANQTYIRTDSKFSFISSFLIGKNVNVVNKALNGGLVVVDGKCSAWRKSFLLEVKDSFLNEHWMGKRSEIGDDRFLSREALKRGFKTVYQDSAEILVPSPKTFKNFLLQQLRWRRSGVKYWLKDLKEGIAPSKTYVIHNCAYHAAPFVFLAAALSDILFFRLPFNLGSVWSAFGVLVIGVSLVTLIWQLIYHNKSLVRFWHLTTQGLIGLFVLMPISLYGALTIKNQYAWLSREYTTGDSKKEAVALAALPVILAPCLFSGFSLALVTLASGAFMYG